MSFTVDFVGRSGLTYRYWNLVNVTAAGIQAVGGNIKAAELSGIDTRGTLLVAYGVCAMLAAV